MNKNAIEKFAVWARTELIRQVSQRAYQYGVTAEDFGDPQATAVNGRVLSNEEKEQRAELIKHVQQKGYDQTMEEMAYTWFNRLTALRFMEVNNYLPTHIRVFTNMEGEFKPDILSMALTIDLPGIDREKAARYIDESRDEDLYRYLLLTQCNALSEPLPGMFEKLGSYTELLLPNNILRQDSVIGRLISDIPEEDWKEQVEIIGWLYQYYNSEKKDQVFAALKKNVKISKENLPAATQLFTPEWIVEYMVQNSLGRLWIEGHPDEDLKAGWKYYLDEAEQEPEVEAKLEKIRSEYREIRPQDIKIIDPCMGSGHILSYVFDLLMQIYEKSGESRRNAVKSIVENNLYGLEIDKRASQLAYFEIMMKGCQYDGRFLKRSVQPNVCAIPESNGIGKEIEEYFVGGDPRLQKDLSAIIREFHDAEEYGAILNVENVNFDGLYRRIKEIEDDIHLYRDSVLLKVLPLIKAAQIMSAKYDVVVTNPPYMGSSSMGTKLSSYVKKYYPDSKSDLFAVFMEKCHQMTGENRFQAMITQHAWMFLSSYEKLREKLLLVDTINMVHLGARAFEEIAGEVVQTTSFVMRNNRIVGYKGTFCRLIEPTSQQGKEDMFLAKKNRYYTDQSNFSKIPGSPVAYWVGEDFINIYNSPPLSDLAVVTNGMFTCDNKRFLRMWHEVDLLNIFLNCKSKEDCKIAMKKWYPYNKGGEFRKWYGNHEYIINFFNFGTEISDYRVLSGQSGSFPGQEYYFAKSISWSLVSSSKFGVRFYPSGFVFDIAGSSIFPNHDNCFYYILAFLSTAISVYFLELTNPTINFQVGDIKRIPIVIDSTKVNVINNNAIDNIKISNSDWDSYETSWDFKKHPMV